MGSIYNHRPVELVAPIAQLAHLPSGEDAHSSATEWNGRRSGRFRSPKVRCTPMRPQPRRWPARKYEAARGNPLVATCKPPCRPRMAANDFEGFRLEEAVCSRVITFAGDVSVGHDNEHDRGAEELPVAKTLYFFSARRAGATSSKRRCSQEKPDRVGDKWATPTRPAKRVVTSRPPTDATATTTYADTDTGATGPGN